MDDPFVDNFTPCFAEGGILEVGDPLVLVDFPGPSMASLSNPQDLTFLSYFTGDFPSKGANQFFTFRGTFHFPCASCNSGEAGAKRFFEPTPPWALFLFS
jgi:hypothetical protein